jgi:hypothetical protein
LGPKERRFTGWIDFKLACAMALLSMPHIASSPCEMV